MTKQPIKLAVVDDHPLFREGVARSLMEIGGFQIVAEGSSAMDALRIAEDNKPDILLLDVSMPGGGLEAVGAILSRFPTQKIVMLTVAEANEGIAKALNAGAKGYVLKGVGSKSLAEILTAVAAGETYLSPELSAKLFAGIRNISEIAQKKEPADSLTLREREILESVAQGLSNKRVALKLNLQEKTIKHHMTSIMAKLGVSNRTEAALFLRNKF